MGRSVQSGAAAIECGSLVSPGRQMVSGQEVARRAAALAAELRRLHVAPADRVAIATADGEAFFVAFAACLASGFTAVVIDPLAAGDEIRRMLEHSGPVAAIADDAVVRAVADSTGAPPSIPTILVGGSGRSERKGVAGWLPWRQRAADSAELRFDAVIAVAANLEWREVSDAIAAYVIFTSGTTSTPKGVVISRRALFDHVRTLGHVFGYGPAATLLHYLPLHHTDGLVHGPAAALLTGMRVVRPGAFTAQTAEAMPGLLREHRVTHFLAVPTILSIVHRSYRDRADLFRTEWFQHAISTAGALPEEFWQTFEATFGIRLSNFYGMTETVSGSLYCGPDDASYRRGTLGKPVDCTLRIVDAQGAPCPPGQVGVLEISGSHLMDGYLANPEATAAVVRDGWLDTGDLFRVDGDGFHVFAGRRKTVIKRGGITIYPEDVRRALEPLDWVREVEVIGAPDPTFEQIAIVCAVLDPGKTAADVHAECARRLAPERRPDRVLLMTDLPRGPSGKVQREALLARATQAPAETADDGSISGRVRAIAARIFQVEAATLTDNTGPADLPNWDSYAQIELALALEKQFSMRLTPKDLMQLRSIGHAVAIVTRRLDPGHR